jgi:hypothetical protein
MYFVHDLVYLQITGIQILSRYQQKYLSFFLFHSLVKPEQEMYFFMLSFGYFPGAWSLYVDVWEHSVPSSQAGRRV